MFKLEQFFDTIIILKLIYKVPALQNFPGVNFYFKNIWYLLLLLT